MNIGEVTKTLQEYVETSEKNLETILRGPVKEYLTALMDSPNMLAAVMHTTGSEADEALRFNNALEGTTTEELAEAVTRQLARGIVSTSLVPALLPSPLLSNTNHAILSCLRQHVEQRTLDSTVVEED